jgi:hypothetical protein
VNYRTLIPVILGILLWPAVGLAQSRLPLVEDIEPDSLLAQCRQLKSHLPTELARKLSQFTDAKEKPQEDVSLAIQRILDPHCLIGVTINPESRVKVARGPREAELVNGQETLVLVKVQNDAGVTEGLKVSGDQVLTGKEKAGNRWLEASIVAEKPLRTKLSGKKLEYVLLRLKPQTTGKREATLKFDVGQGTQDLGFRGEVPVLFTIREAKKP